MNNTLDKIKEFHGHLGPYVVIDYRMGLVANDKSANEFKKNACVFTGLLPPMSCLIDGVQLSSGCTLGKGNIRIENKGEPRTIFSNKEDTKSIEISLKNEVYKMIKEKMVSWDSGDELAKIIYQMSDEDLLIIRNL